MSTDMIGVLISFLTFLGLISRILNSRYWFVRSRYELFCATLISAGARVFLCEY